MAATNVQFLSDESKSQEKVYVPRAIGNGSPIGDPFTENAEIFPAGSEYTNLSSYVKYIKGADMEWHATTGAAGAGYAATSSTTSTIGTGSKSFTTQAGLAYEVGQRVRVSFNTTNYEEGVVTSYSGTTLVFTSDLTVGSGSHSSWTIGLAGNPGVTNFPIVLLPGQSFIVPAAMQIVSVKEQHDTAASIATKLMVRKCTGTTAPAAGTALLTDNTNTGLDVNGLAANTVTAGTLTGTTANLQFADGDRIAVTLSSAGTNLAGCTVTVYVTYL